MNKHQLADFLTNLYEKYGDLPFDPVSEEKDKEYQELITEALKANYLKIYTSEDLDNVLSTKLQKGDQVIFSMRGREFVKTGGL